MTNVRQIRPIKPQSCEHCGIEETPMHAVDTVDDVIEITLVVECGAHLCDECHGVFNRRLD